MIDHSGPTQDAPAIFIIQPNHSMSWGALLAAYAVIAGTTLAVAVFFLLLGLPLVLPFSGLEVIALGAALYVTAWRGGVREVITIGAGKVAVESGRQAPQERAEFQQAWARVVLEQRGGWYPSRLWIRSHGRQVEVGRFLNEQERRGLALQLSRVMRP